jgi:hypothetical protein
MFTFRVDVFAWIPQPDVPNPIHSLPGGVARWGVGACGPRFGGDGFVRPPATYAGWNNLTYRARQTLAFKISSFGARPDPDADTGVIPGLTTVLTSPRSSGGRVCTSLTPKVTKSRSGISWVESQKWYEMRLQGAAHDPIPAAAIQYFAGTLGSNIGSALTPDLEWDLTIRVQKEHEIKSRLAKLRYSVADLMNLDSSEKLPARQDFGGTSNLIHGLAYVRRFPSYAIYVTVSGNQRILVSLPVYFADASGRNLGEIVIGQSDLIRQLTW